MAEVGGQWDDRLAALDRQLGRARSTGAQAESPRL
jgi:hypothetical protein